MMIADLSQTAGRVYPARRRAQNLAGGRGPIQTRNFCMGNVILEPNGGQAPWRNHHREESTSSGICLQVLWACNSSKHLSPGTSGAGWISRRWSLS
jgi:hypothetical protein